MGRLGTRRLLIGALLVGAVAVVSASALVFEGRDDAPTATSDTLRSTTTSGRAAAAGPTSSSTSTSTTSTTAPTNSTTPVPTTAPATTPPAPAPAPTPVEVVPPPPAPAPACDSLSNDIIDAMNTDRVAAGLPGLCGNGGLAAYAQTWANWMAKNQSLTHQDLQTVLGGTTFSTVAENILDGPRGMTAGQMESAWMGSAPHRQNILNSGYRAAGVGIAYSSDGRVWVVVDFGG